MSLPLISCIVPVYNGERYIREALDSILAQTYRPLEVLVSDDGSTDGTSAAVDAAGNGIRYIRQDNKGPAAARNTGVEASSGEFIAFLDADDLWSPEKLETQMARFQARPELDYCVCHGKNFWTAALGKEEERLRDHRVSKPLPAYVTGGLLARRRLFSDEGLFDVSLDHGDSMEWFIRANERGAVGELIPEILLHRRLHHSNRIRSKVAQSTDEFLHILKNSLDRRRSIQPKP